MIREAKREEIPICVEIIKRSFATVANEYGITEENAPGFTVFATTTDRLYWHMDGEHRPILEHAFHKAKEAGCKIVNIGIVEENNVLRKWYERNGAIHIGTKKYDFFPFLCGYMKKELF